MATKPKTQISKFRETARSAECDESEERFDTALKKVASSPPSKVEPKRQKPAR